MIEIKNVSVVLGGQHILDNINLAIDKDDVFAITGSSGSGKTSLAKVLTGNLFHNGTVTFHGFSGKVKIGFVSQEHQFKNLSNTSEFYYQQRFNSSESDQSLKVSDLLKSDNHWIDALKLRDVFERPLLQLSNGENKRLQLAQKLEERPDILILDNPFLGLDVAGRKILEDVITVLVGEGVQIILLTVSSMLPRFITHVAVLDHGKLIFEGTRERYLADGIASHSFKDVFDFSLLRSLSSSANSTFGFAVRMHAVHIQYGEKTVLDNISWDVRRGECWSLSG
ncbi:MAG TPA: ATP-binding cassette domain-containing protein, partial [Flavitalea sp.]|nr:ATP-binding cassette domain-containing protein [Flavitalea sp.]